MYLRTFLVAFLPIVVAQDCTATQADGGASGAFGSPLFRLYETFFNCGNTISALNVSLTGNPNSIRTTFSHWRSNNSAFELLNQETVEITGGITALEVILTSNMWNVLFGDHLGIGTSDPRMVRANTVAGQDEVDKGTTFAAVYVRDASWANVLRVLNASVLLANSQVDSGRGTSAPLVSPIIHTATPMAMEPGGTDFSGIRTTTTTTASPSTSNICPVLRTVGGSTVNIRGSPRAQFSIAQAKCPGTAAQSRYFRCVANATGSFQWMGGFEEPTVTSFGEAIYVCRPVVSIPTTADEVKTCSPLRTEGGRTRYLNGMPVNGRAAIGTRVTALCPWTPMEDRDFICKLSGKTTFWDGAGLQIFEVAGSTITCYPT